MTVEKVVAAGILAAMSSGADRRPPAVDMPAHRGQLVESFEPPTTRSPSMNARTPARPVACVVVAGAGPCGLSVVERSDFGVLVRHMRSRVAVLNGGYVVEVGDSEEVLGNPQSEYTRALLAAAPDLELWGDRVPAAQLALGPVHRGSHAGRPGRGRRLGRPGPGSAAAQHSRVARRTRARARAARAEGLVGRPVRARRR